ILNKEHQNTFKDYSIKVTSFLQNEKELTKHFIGHVGLLTKKNGEICKIIGFSSAKWCDIEWRDHIVIIGNLEPGDSGASVLLRHTTDETYRLLVGIVRGKRKNTNFG